ncbi:MAG: hypothetical protein LH645_01960 [Actinomycetia bacterium]|nr:hypothetical protein [Actinomycetes bacterium]
MFFDDYPRFLTTSTTANNPLRLHIRYRAMFEANAAIFRGARVVDIASHDGRWTMAANKMGATFTTGIEFRSEMVKHAEENFTEYSVPKDTYRFINDDVFEVLQNPSDFQLKSEDAEVVMCLGFIYHTLRYQDLFSGIRKLNPKYLLIDSGVIANELPFIRVHVEDSSKQAAGADTTFDLEGHLITGRPSPSALELMLNAHGFEVVKKFDWPTFLEENFPDQRSAESYQKGRRVTWLCEPR